MSKLLYRLACFIGLHHGVIWRHSRTGEVVAHECWHCGRRKVFL